MSTYTLSDLYNECLAQNQWFYDRSFNIEILGDSNECFGRLKQLLENRKKDDFRLYKDFFKGNQEHLKSRAQHILSCYMLGKILYENIPAIKEAVNEFIKTYHFDEIDGIEPFRYIWMLICLFHDLGYVYESLGIYKQDNVENLIENLSDELSGVPVGYTKDLLKSYDNYRNCRFAVTDHGIIGGVKLYDDLNKHFSGRNSLDDNRKKLHSCVSWVVACHNLFIGESKNQCYPCKALYALISDGKSRNIKLPEHPLLFLFDLVDSIEPMKLFGGTEILSEISVSFSCKSISFNLDKLCNEKKQQYARKIQDLNNWLTDVNDLTIQLL